MHVSIGGHTAEMTRLLRNMDGGKYRQRTYVVADSDSLSRSKIEQFESDIDGGSFDIVAIPRSRNVGQSYITSVFTTLYACFAAFRVVFQRAPDVVCADRITSIERSSDQSSVGVACLLVRVG
jgi:beta-1,4-N-acetylglucosaminyltransferase